MLFILYISNNISLGGASDENNCKNIRENIISTYLSANKESMPSGKKCKTSNSYVDVKDMILTINHVTSKYSLDLLKYTLNKLKDKLKEKNMNVLSFFWEFNKFINKIKDSEDINGKIFIQLKTQIISNPDINDVISINLVDLCLKNISIYLEEKECKIDERINFVGYRSIKEIISKLMNIINTYQHKACHSSKKNNKNAHKKKHCKNENSLTIDALRDMVTRLELPFSLINSDILEITDFMVSFKAELRGIVYNTLKSIAKEGRFMIEKLRDFYYLTFQNAMYIMQTVSYYNLINNYENQLYFIKKTIFSTSQEHFSTELNDFVGLKEVFQDDWSVKELEGKIIEKHNSIYNIQKELQYIIQKLKNIAFQGDLCNLSKIKLDRIIYKYYREKKIKMNSLEPIPVYQEIYRGEECDNFKNISYFLDTNSLSLGLPSNYDIRIILVNLIKIKEYLRKNKKNKFLNCNQSIIYKIGRNIISPLQIIMDQCKINKNLLWFLKYYEMIFDDNLLIKKIKTFKTLDNLLVLIKYRENRKLIQDKYKNKNIIFEPSCGLFVNNTLNLYESSGCDVTVRLQAILVLITKNYNDVIECCNYIMKYDGICFQTSRETVYEEISALIIIINNNNTKGKNIGKKHHFNLKNKKNKYTLNKIIFFFNLSLLKYCSYYIKSQVITYNAIINTIQCFFKLKKDVDGVITSEYKSEELKICFDVLVIFLDLLTLLNNTCRECRACFEIMTQKCHIIARKLDKNAQVTRFQPGIKQYEKRTPEKSKIKQVGLKRSKTTIEKDNPQGLLDVGCNNNKKNICLKKTEIPEIKRFRMANDLDKLYTSKKDVYKKDTHVNDPKTKRINLMKNVIKVIE